MSNLLRCHSLRDRRKRSLATNLQVVSTLVFENARRDSWIRRWPRGSEFSARCDLREE